MTFLSSLVDDPGLELVTRTFLFGFYSLCVVAIAWWCGRKWQLRRFAAIARRLEELIREGNAIRDEIDGKPPLLEIHKWVVQLDGEEFIVETARTKRGANLYVRWPARGASAEKLAGERIA